MKKVILLLSICFYITQLHAQRFESKPLDDSGESYEVRIKHYNKFFGAELDAEKLAPLSKESAKTQQRLEKRNQCVQRLLNKQLKQILKQIGETEGGGFWVAFYLDKTGKVVTVKFMLSATTYTRISTKTLKELYNIAMNEKFDPSCYNFDDTHIYAIDGCDLMKRAIEEEKN